ncbi:hypothetical protein NJT12_06155 [Flavobacterium sp. AC]|uniref:DUF4935 domain-containing protein n=1 Tax=Flavobacterium azizsancarii TaxID=2961580 RepID=A0ABT4WAD9_9FLAO|nr:hypothetical protein [Flavobacterium azizsancarii]MDA6069197.1 hypothetical protein [Flavobacterium azizsancarii]
MSNITCILDACSVINLIHIDEDDFLQKKLEKLDIRINELVFKEIRSNVYNKLNLIDKRISADSSITKDLIKNIEIQLTYFRSKIKLNEDVFKDLGDDYFERIGEITGYIKANGELHSTALALYLSRTESKKIFFYTDDYPAKNEFSSFFEFQQIGQIKDSVDLLVLLFWIDENFSKAQLLNFISKLFSEYAIEVSFLEKELKSYLENNVDAKFAKTNPGVRENLKELISKLSNHNFSKISENKEFFEQKKQKCKIINDIIKKYNKVFELQNTSIDILVKIRNLEGDLKTNKVYKILDLC